MSYSMHVSCHVVNCDRSYIATVCNNLAIYDSPLILLTNCCKTILDPSNNLLIFFNSLFLINLGTTVILNSYCIFEVNREMG